MKKFTTIVAALALAASTTAMAELTMVNPAPAKSPTTAFLQAIAAAHGDAKVELVKGCENSMPLANEKQGVHSITSDHVAKRLSKGINCTAGVKVKPEQVVIMADNSYAVCRLPSTTKTLTDAGVTVGRHNGHPLDSFEKDFNKHNNASIKVVPFQGSKNTLIGVLNGDVDWGVIAGSVAKGPLSEGKLDCPYDTSPAGSTTGKSLNDAYKLKLDGFALEYMIVLPSGDAAEMAKLKSAVNSDVFQTYLKKGDFYNVRTAPTQADIDNFNKNVDNFVSYTNYGKEADEPQGFWSKLFK